MTQFKGEIADKEGLVEIVSNLNPTELQTLVKLNAMQTLTLEAALKKLF